MNKNRKVFVITGASSGIGLEIGLKALETGARVVFSSRTIEEVCPSQVKEAENAFLFNADVSDENSVRSLFEYVEKQFGRLDVLVNNAGYVKPAALMDTLFEDWQKTLNINLSGTFLCTKYAVYLMRKQGGKIVNISSTAALSARPGWSAYAAAKSGIISFSEAMAEELREYGIKVFVFCPGRTATPLRKILAPNEDPSSIMQPEAVAEIVSKCFDDDFDVLEGQPIIIRQRF